MHRWFALGLLSLLMAGCEPLAEEEAPADDANAVVDTTLATATPVAPPANFANVDEALAALTKATDAKDTDAVKAAYNWLSQQDGSAVPAVVAAMNNASASIEARRIACRALSQLGAASAAPLVEASRSDELPLKLKAIEAMPAVDPQQKIIVDRLIVLLDDENDQARRAAIRSLGQIGPAAKRSAKKLIAIQNNPRLDEMTRDEADMAVKRVNPRKTFND